jgi:hypothetical protein
VTLSGSRHARSAPTCRSCWFGNPISGELEAKVAEKLRNNGVTIKEGTDIADVLDLDGRTYLVYTTGGEEIRCQMVVVATERLPVVHFLEGSGVKVGTGILVDEYLLTNVSNIFAAGDCAEVFDINRRESRIKDQFRVAQCDEAGAVGRREHGRSRKGLHPEHRGLLRAPLRVTPAGQEVGDPKGETASGVLVTGQSATGDPVRCEGFREAACGARCRSRRAEPEASGRRSRA